MAMGVDAFNPVGGTNSFLSFAAPTILDPIADLGKNENFFGGRIYPEQNPFTPYKPASQQHWSNTSAGWKLIAQSLNTLTGGNEYQSGYIDHSPEVYEYWFDFATGSAGKFVSRVTSGAGMLLTGDIVDIEANDIPLVRKLYGEVGKRADVERYYNNKEEVLAVRQAVKDAVKNGDRERAKEIRQDEKARLSIAGAFASIDRAISNLRAQRKRLLANENISDDKRDKMVERVEGLIERQITRANRLYNERVKGK
jgi:hypothetical protein